MLDKFVVKYQWFFDEILNIGFTESKYQEYVANSIFIVPTEITYQLNSYCLTINVFKTYTVINFSYTNETLLYNNINNKINNKININDTLNSIIDKIYNISEFKHLNRSKKISKLREKLDIN
jgi:hypothetical protein